MKFYTIHNDILKDSQRLNILKNVKNLLSDFGPTFPGLQTKTTPSYYRPKRRYVKNRDFVLETIYEKKTDKGIVWLVKIKNKKK